MATNVDAKLLKQTKFPAEFSQKVDMKKVNVEVMKKWIAGKISEVLGNEDDVVIELCFNLLEGSRFVRILIPRIDNDTHTNISQQPDIKVLQIQLTGFLDKDTPKFCKELWTLCLSAQSNPQGVPKELLEAKKLELIQEKVLHSLLKRLKSAKSKNAPAKEPLKTCDRESGRTVGEVEEEAKEHTTITIDVLQGFQGLHLLAGALHLTETTTVDLRAVISWIPIFLEAEATERVGTIRAEDGHRHRGGLCVGPYLDR
ncbi:MAG: hypothetical protein LQ346_004948 [Caloplaca aetnensis]|nr:MAG: hypothetical protein LQ346_004948 [Caloplaca aetnensis]